MIGKKLAHYEITSQIGKGGMGEVYQAKDTKLGRDVAIKVLPEEFANDPSRVFRFQREAKLLASLNHPNIAAIYGLEESDDTHFLVMELIPGDTLADRIKRGPIPVEESLKLALQITEALEAAHEKGVIHRDLKPANIKVTPEGKVKVLDFGLAKAFAGEQTEKVLSDSPTISVAAAQQGVILGTAAYMSPEQARGKAVDKGADIWAFGVVLYEMIIGEMLFKCEDLTETLAAVVMKEPDLSDIPSKVRKVLEACLHKDPRKRLQAIGDWELLLDTGPPEKRQQAKTRSMGSRLVPWAVAVLAIIAAIVPWALWTSAPEAPSLQLNVALPQNAQPSFLEISPDGRRLLTVIYQDGLSSLWLRSLDSPEWHALSGTDNARSPFWSPDSRFIGFFADGKLKKIPAAGGPVQELCSGAGGLGNGGTWSREGVILFADSEFRLRRVDGDGGACSPVGGENSNLSASFPMFLPDGNNFLYVRGEWFGDPAASGVYLASLSDSAPKKVLADRSSVVYAPAVGDGPAHLLFLRENVLMAQPFDEEHLAPVGDPFRVAAEASFTYNSPQVAASFANGTLVYVAARSEASQLTWFDRTGKEMGVAGPQVKQNGVALSQDGKMALTIQQLLGNQSAVCLYDLIRGAENRLAAQTWTPIWCPDGNKVLAIMGNSDGMGLYILDTTGGAPAKLIHQMEMDAVKVPSCFSPDGKYLIYTLVASQMLGDIWYLPWSDNLDWNDAAAFLATGAVESQGQLSPDGKWIAYTSGDSGEPGVYIRSFPSGTGVRRVSIGPGIQPRWKADGSELFFLGLPSGRVSATNGASLFTAGIQPDGSGGLQIGIPQKLFDVQVPIMILQGNIWSYDVHPDGRFLVNIYIDPGRPTINVITNWRPAAPE